MKNFRVDVHLGVSAPWGRWQVIVSSGCQGQAGRSKKSFPTCLGPQCFSSWPLYLTSVGLPDSTVLSGYSTALRYLPGDRKQVLPGQSTQIPDHYSHHILLVKGSYRLKSRFKGKGKRPHLLLDGEVCA